MLIKYKMRVLLLIVFIFSFQFLRAEVGVISANELEVILARDDVDAIVLEDNITLTKNIDVTPRNVKIRGNGYDLTRAGYYLNATGTSGSYDITFDGISSGGSSYLLYNSTASSWNVKMTGINELSSTGGTIFRETASSSTFTVDTGAVANMSGGGAANGMISNYKNNVIKGEANISTSSSGRGIYTTAADAVLQVTSSGKLITNSSAGTTYEAVGLSNGGTVDINGQWTASVYGGKAFEGGKATTFNVDGGNVKFSTGVGYSAASAAGAAYEQGSGAAGTINIKNNGTMVIEGKSTYGINSSANSSYDFYVNVERGSTLNAFGVTNGLRTVTITGAVIKLNVKGTAEITSNSGPAIQGGNKTNILVDSGKLTVNSATDNAFLTNGYGTDIKAINSGTIDFSSNGTTAASRVIYISDATATNVSNFEILSGSKFIVTHKGAGNGIYMDDTSDTTITVDGSGSEFKVEATNGSYALYTQKYGTDFYVTNGAKAEFISGRAGSNTFYLSDAGSPSNINILGGASFNVTNNGTGAARGIYTDEGTTIINLENSELNVNVPNVTGTGYGIYIYNPTTTIKADNKSKININTGGSGSAAALRTGTGNTKITVQGASQIKAINNSSGGAVLELNSGGEFNVTGADSQANIEITNSSNSSSAVSGTSSGFTINLTNLAEMYISNRSSSNATLNAGGGVVFNDPSAYDVKNLGGGPAIYNATTATALTLVNTDITMWDKSNSPGFSSSSILDVWSDLNANLLRTGSTTVAPGSKGTTSVTMSNIGRITAFEKSAKKSTIAGGTSTVIDSKTGTYYPGSTIIYEVTYKNDSNFTVAQAVVAKDKLSEIQTALADGTTGQAFKSWTITASNALGSSGTSNGTTLGTYSDNADLDTIIDIAIGDSVTYKITATAADTTVGNIVNTALIGTADVEPSITYTPQSPSLTTAKADGITGTNTGIYYANGIITYKLTISNASNTGFADNVSVSDQLSAIKTALNDSTNGSAFINWTIKKPVLNGTGTSSTISTDITDTTADLTDTADIAPGGSIEYTITAKVNPKAIGEITNIPVINSASVPEAATKHTYTKLDASKTYKGSAEGYIPGTETTYEIIVANNGSGTAGGVTVEDMLSNEKTYKLDGTTEIPAYTSWTITSAVSGTVSGNSSGITTDLNDTLTIGPGSSVTYTVKAIVNSEAAGVISNTAKVGGEEVKAADINPVNDKSKVQAVKKLETNLPGNLYNPGQIVEYTIEIENTGTSPVKGYNIQDIKNAQKTKDLLGNEINAFDSWVVTGTIISGEAKNVTLTSESTDLNDTIDLGPGAKVHYSVEVQINPNAADAIINTVKADGQEIKSPVINPEKGLSNIVATKTYTGPAQGYTPGQQVTYELKLGNPGTASAIGVTAVDMLSAETTTDINGTLIPAYTSWTITSQILGAVYGNSTGITTDLNDTLNIGVGGLVVYTITATVNPEAAGKIGNTAKVNGNDITDPSGPKDPENGKSNVTAVKTYTGPSQGYTPGGQVTYELKLTNTGTALATGVTAIDKLSSETTTDINGASVPAYTSWTITSVKAGSVSGNSNGITTDLNDTLTMAGGSTVTYTITAAVNTDAAGKIGNTAKINDTDVTDPSGPKDPEDGKSNVTATKTYTGPSQGYTPGQQVTYELKLTNSGTALAVGVTAIDTLSSETTTDINGASVPAYTSWTITSVKTGSVSGNSTGITTDLNDTLNMGAGATVTYTITATVNTDAAGKIGNTAKINDTDVTDPSGPKDPEDGKSNVTAVKTYTGPSQGYTPGGQVTYELKLTNTGTALATGVTAVDTLSSETTTDIDGASVPAYTSWTITSVNTGSVTGNSTGITTDLNDTLTMSGGSTVTYTITATVNTDAAGKIGNTAKVNGNDITDPSGPKDPEDGKSNVTATKTYTGPSQGYTPGQQVTYELRLTNSGTALATGVTAIDILSSETTTDINGASVPAYTSWTITSVKTGSVSGNSTGITTDLNDTLVMSGGSTVTYTITATVNTDAAGKIGNTAKINDTDVTDPSGPKDPEDGKSNVTAVKIYTGPSQGYTPGQQVTYELKLTNSGTALALGVTAVDTLSSETTTDINGSSVPAYTSWTITSVKTGSVSGNSSGITTDLNDTLTMAGGSTVTYTITATVNTDAAGKIGNTAKVSGNDITDPSGPKDPEDGKSNVTAVKTYTGPSQGYTPGGQVTYELKLTNSGTALATGVTAIDILSSETTTNINGTSVPAYTSWTITSVKTGSVSGNSSGITTDLNDTLTMAGGSTVIYTITATVNTDAAGKIGNTAKINGTDVTDPSGPKDPEDGKSNVTAVKTYTGPSQGYTPGQQVTYELKLTNSGTALATGVTAVDALSLETTTDINGSSIPAYTSWTIISVKTGSVSGNSTGITTDLNDTLTMYGGSTVTYTITATVNTDAAGKIGNTAKINGTDVTDPSGPKDPEDGKSNVTATKTYTGPSQGYTPGQQVTYELKLTNSGTALATGVTAIDILSSETTTDINGTSVPAYTSWTITSVKTGSVSGNSTGITTDLNDTLAMSGGSTVTYTITATVNTVAAGKIGNTAKVNGNNITDPSGPKDPENGKDNVTAVKTYTGPSQGYTPGGQVTYELKLTNSGTALAIGVTAVDALSSETTTNINGSSVPAYTSWTITSVKTGSVSGNSSGITSDLSDTLNMGAGATVTYTITATVNTDAAGKIGNTAKVNGNDITDPSGPKDPEDGKSNVTATKTYTGPSQGYTPGGQVTYELKLTNTGTALATGVTAVDTLSSETTTDINGSSVPAYTSWTITSVKAGSVSGNSSGITSDLSDTLNMGAGATVTYTITATVNINAAGKIGNTAKVNGNNITDPSGPKDPENGKDNVTATKTYIGPSQGYTPGEQVTYELKLTNTGTALATGVTAVDVLSGETTTDINGTSVPAYTSWTITSVKTGSVSGNSTGITTDLNDTLAMSGGSTVTYTITATVNTDAAGKIGNTAKVNGNNITDPSGPKDPEDGKSNITAVKTYTGPSQGYTPGEQVTYELKLTNTGTALATGVTAVDTLSSETTTNIDGSSVPAYTSWTITSSKTGSVSGNSNGITTDLNDTLTIAGGSTVTYTITATVNTDAAGKIGNTAKVNGNNITDPSGPKDPEDGKSNVTATKTYTGSSQGYTPGGQVTYELKLTNSGTALATGVTAIDILSSETTTDINGTSVPAYTSWTITSVKTGSVSGNSSGIATDLNDTLIMSGGSTVTYTITATVNTDAAGKIGNTAKVNGNDITDPSGPKDPEDGKGNVTAVKTYTGPSQGYTPGGQVTYELKLTNSGTALATGVTAVDALSSEITTNINGSSIPAYTSWTITSVKTGSVSGNSSGITTDLNDTLIMSGGSAVTYTITATVNTDAAGKIGNTAKVNGNNITDPSGPKDPEDGKSNVTATKTYTGPSQGYTPGEQVSYELKLTNSGTALAIGVTAIDTLSSETTTDINGTSVPAYTSWTITSVKTGSVSGNSSGITANLNDTLNMGAGSTVTYTITATVNTNAAGKIGNTAKVNGNNITDPSGPKDPENNVNNIRINKELVTDLSNGYTPGQTVQYKITVENQGTVLALGYNVKDIRTDQKTTDMYGTAIDTFTSWQIKGTVVSGSAAGVTSNTTGDLNDIISLSSGGKVEYLITAVIDTNAAGKITNKGVGNGNSVEPPTPPVDPENNKGNISAKKELITDLSNGYTPGQTVQYKIVLENTGTTLVSGYEIKDIRTNQKTTDISGNSIDSFTGWTITGTVTNGTGSGVTPSTTGDLNDTVSLSAGGKIEYMISAVINTDAAGKITNAGLADGNKIEPSTPPAEPVNDKSKVTVKKELVTSLSNGYMPGQTIEYKITLKNTGVSPVNNYSIKDIRADQKTTDLLGNSIDSFTSWMIAGAVTAGTGVGVTSNTTGDLNDILTLSSGAVVEYTVNAVINTNAAGKITNAGLADGNSVEPSTPSVDPATDNSKVTAVKEIITNFENGYTAGERVEYKITVENKGNVIAKGNVVKDIRLDQKTFDFDGNTINAFDGWTVSGKVVSGQVYGVTGTTTSDLNDTINMGPNSKVEYIVSAVIHRDAYNDIINTGFLNGTELKTASIKAKPEAADLTISITASKDIVELGETIEYTVRVYNKGRVTRTGLNVKNLLPVGFSYIDETVAYKKDSSKSRTASAAGGRLSASNTGDVIFSTFDLNPKEEIIITYAAKIGTTIQPGKYKTSAIAREDSQEVTGAASATVQVTGNSIANSASIIGKVFEDVNGDGIQNDAGANKIIIKDAVNGSDYVDNTAELIMLDASGKEISRKKVNDNDLIFNGIKIEKIEGKSLNKTLKGVNKVIVRTEIKTPEIQETFMTITTKEGMELTYNKGIISTLGSKGDVKSGMSSQEFYISKEIKRSGTKYIQEVTIENVGIQEEGIAGAKLRTPTGITVTTDEYGRYHVPDEYVEKERGKNFIIKVDEASLPKGMKVITENPRVKLITQYGLNEFNFGVQSEKRGEE